MRIALAAVGFTSTIAQVVLMRELVATFYGNELLFGLVLTAWLAWVAAGSWGLARLAERYLATAWEVIAYIADRYRERVFLGVGLPYNSALIGLDEVQEFGRWLAAIGADVQLCVLDYFPTFRRRDLRRPSPSEMLRVKWVLEETGSRAVVVQTAVGHSGPGAE